jgi:hypothetical protein
MTNPSIEYLGKYFFYKKNNFKNCKLIRCMFVYSFGYYEMLSSILAHAFDSPVIIA